MRNNKCQRKLRLLKMIQFFSSIKIISAFLVHFGSQLNVWLSVTRKKSCLYPMKCANAPYLVSNEESPPNWYCVFFGLYMRRLDVIMPIFLQPMSTSLISEIGKGQTQKFDEHRVVARYVWTQCGVSVIVIAFFFSINISNRNQVPNVGYAMRSCVPKPIRRSWKQSQSVGGICLRFKKAFAKQSDAISLENQRKVLIWIFSYFFEIYIFINSKRFQKKNIFFTIDCFIY